MKLPKFDFYKSNHGPVAVGVTYFDRYGRLPFELTVSLGRYRLDIIGR